MIRTFLVLGLFILSSLITKGQSYLDRLETQAEFKTLAGLPISGKYGQLDAVKVVFDLESEVVYFLNAKNFEYHHEFCSRVLKNFRPLGTFNDINYTNTDKREYLLANLNYVPNRDLYFLELSPSDLMDIDHIERLYNEVVEHSFLGRDLYFFINSYRLQNQVSDLNHLSPFFPSELYKDLVYQKVSEGKAKGTLKYIKNLKKEFDNILPTDIIVLHKTPLLLPKVAGIIVTEFQTPLSHLSILGQNREIPIMVLKNAETNKDLISYKNQNIQLTVTSDTFLIKPIEKLPTIRKRKKTLSLRYDLKPDSLITLDKAIKKGGRFIGNKASNFAELVQLSTNANFQTPESAFAIPFYFYQEHIEASGADKLINQLLLYQAHQSSTDTIKYILKEIRNKIRYQTLDGNLMNQVQNRALDLGEYKKLRFRSSTNAEDRAGFSGAGLYTSSTGIIHDMDKPIDEAIKKVWASLWSYGAYMERQYFDINQRTVYMGVLVHRSFPNELVNGVAITKNLYRDSYFGYVVNAQEGNESVVKPSKGVICDQFVCYPTNLNNMYDENNTIEIIATSSLGSGQLLMTEKEINNLANQLQKIKQHFYDKTPQTIEFNQFAMDVEFKIDQNGQLYIKQAREFNP